MRSSDVQRLIENLEEGIKRNSEKGYEIGSLEEAQKFSESRNATPAAPLDLEKFPVSYSTSEKKFPNP